MARQQSPTARRHPSSMSVNISRLGRRPGQMFSVRDTLPSPSRIGLELIAIEVVLALPGEQRLVALQVPAGTTLAEAVERAGLLRDAPGLRRQDCGVAPDPGVRFRYAGLRSHRAAGQAGA